MDNIIYGDHKTKVMPCMGIRQDAGAMCGALIGVVLDIGPAALRCPICGCLYIVDPLVGAENANEMQGHKVEIILSEKSIPSRFDDIESFLMAKVGSLGRIYRAPVYSGPGEGFDFFDEIQKAVMNNRQASVDLCNLAIRAKRKGEYNLALKHYDEARQADPTNPQVYYNIGKLHFGLGNYDKSFRNFLTYTHIGLLEELFTPTFLQLTGFGPYFWPSGIINEEISVPPNIVQALYSQAPPLFAYVSDPNLTRYAGLCYIAQNESVLSYHRISKEQIKDIQNGVLGKPSQEPAGMINLTRLAMLIGSLYLAQNLAPEGKEIYLSKERFSVDKDLSKWCSEKKPNSHPIEPVKEVTLESISLTRYNLDQFLSDLGYQLTRNNEKWTIEHPNGMIGYAYSIDRLKSDVENIAHKHGFTIDWAD